MRIPAAPAPPPLTLPTESDDAVISQPPLSTPVDQPVIHREAITASPHRTAVKRRRTVFNAPPIPYDDVVRRSCTNAPKNTLFSCRSFLNDDDSLQHSSSQLLSQREMPEMSQDTLALFPNIVREHQLMALPKVRNSQSSSKSDLADPPCRRLANTRRPKDASIGLARASLISTLAGAEAMHNPFLISRDENPAADIIGEQSVSSAEHAMQKKHNASESFLNLNNAFQSDDDDLARHKRTAAPYSLPSEHRKKHEAEKLKVLKLLLVSSTQSRNFAIDFEQVALAGVGGFSEVFRAKHRLDGCTYAVKKNQKPLHSDKARLDSLQEVFALSALQGHPNILRYHDAWFEDRGKYLLLQTEFLPEGNLQTLYTDKLRAMPLTDLLALVSDVSCALSHMHSKGIVHLDIKPDNIFRCSRGMVRDSFIVGDFGLACHVDGYDARPTEGDSRYLCPEALTESSRFRPSPNSDRHLVLNDEDSDISPTPKKSRRVTASKPESFRDLRAEDVFSLGASIYELAMGVPLKKSGPQWRALRTDTEGVSREVEEKCGSSVLARIVRRCLERDPKKRATAVEIRQTVQAHDSSESARKIKQLEKELSEAQARIKKFEKVTSSILASGEAGRRQYRSTRSQGAKMRTFV